jgi:hypothetical protein
MRLALRESLTPSSGPDNGHTAEEVAAAVGASDLISRLVDEFGADRKRLEGEVVRAACARGDLACVGFKHSVRSDGRRERVLVYTPANRGVPVFAESIDE